MHLLRDIIFLFAFAAILSGAIAGQLDPPAPRPTPRHKDSMATIHDLTNDGRFSVRLDIIHSKSSADPGDATIIHFEASTMLAEDTIGAVQLEYWPLSGRTVTYVTPAKPDPQLDVVLHDVVAELGTSRADLLTRNGQPPGFVRVPWRPAYEGHWLLRGAKPG